MCSTGKLYRQIARNENVAFSDPQSNFCGEPFLFYCKSRAASCLKSLIFYAKVIKVNNRFKKMHHFTNVQAAPRLGRR